MKRWLIEDMRKWKRHPRRKPLLLIGARQIGKTWLMQEFGRQEFAKVVYISFDDDEEMRHTFEIDYNVPRLLEALQLRVGFPLTPEDTLIILDEIQECPSAITSLKYFCERAPEYAVIAAGSLLGIAEHRGTGFPVGKVNRLRMYPMSFTEYLDATGDGQYVELLRNGDWRTINTFSQSLEQRLRSYFFVGGMPGAVAAFADSRDYAEVRSIQDDLLLDFRDDFRKHSSSDEAKRIAQIWDSIPGQLGREDKRFVYSHVEEGVHANQLKGPQRWLEDAGLVSPVFRAALPQHPLEAYKDAAFKLYFLDVGLLAAKCRLQQRQLVDRTAVFTQYKGALTEQYVQQQLRAECGWNPYYWTAERAQAEVDFLLPTDDGVFAMEVKAERSLKARSLQSFYRRYRIPLAVRVSMSPYSVQKVSIPATKTTEAGAYTLLDIPLSAVCRVASECAAIYEQEGL